MKTTSSVPKTENRNWRISNVKTLIVLLGVAMFGFIGHAGARANQAAEGNKHLLALTTVSTLSPAAVRMHATAAGLEVNAEAMLKVESWMTNERFFVSAPVVEAEAMLEVESWMINEGFFVSPAGVAESEEPMSVEDWMVSEPNFSAPIIRQESEYTLEVEDWMMNESVWGR